VICVTEVVCTGVIPFLVQRITFGVLEFDVLRFLRFLFLDYFFLTIGVFYGSYRCLRGFGDVGVLACIEKVNAKMASAEKIVFMLFVLD
jgi:hypothetical protein